ncbi:hypothetical protein AMTRI_Chr08g202260 [Amborella trichopoda]|uniref:uncharacterized protein LOC105420927 n=1 Tax=Amborella trichopoda TaxID=13333 RepID=UPI0005D319C9|nr:uncharacterized protein LOC105420927 [Amborella trichopoda]|eukprot:XP_011624731.1 uncharacterized protein LOC105420927 [Amborella trichopoda]
MDISGNSAVPPTSSARCWFRKSLITRRAIFLCFIWVLFMIFLSVFKLPEASENGDPLSLGILNLHKRFQDYHFGVIGEIMLSMLNEDLPFTLFLPSEAAFERLLKINVNGTSVYNKENNTDVILSRVLGFSVIPIKLRSEDVPLTREISFDSLAGFELNIMRLPEKVLSVDNVRSERVDMRRGEIIVHVMDGVIMDAEFAQSMKDDYEV